MIRHISKEDLLAKTYPEIKFIRNKERFAGLLEATLKEMIEDPSIGEPQLEEIDSLYKTVYSREALQNSVKTTEYKMLPLDAIPTSPLTKKKIVGLSDTPFAVLNRKHRCSDDRHQADIRILFYTAERL